MTSTSKNSHNGGLSSANSINHQNTSNSLHTGSSRKKEKNIKQIIETEEIVKETIHVYDGDSSLRKRVFRTIIVPQSCSYKILLEASLRTFHTNDDPNKYYITIPLFKSSMQQNLFEDLQIEERKIDSENPIKYIKKIFNDDEQSQNKIEILLRYIDEVVENIRIFSGLFK